MSVARITLQSASSPASPSASQGRTAGRETVRLTNVSKSYGAVRALRGASLTLHEGEVTALVGPNGAGKSTLLSLVGTLTRPTSGKVEHLDFDSRERVRASLGWLGHEGLLYPDLSGLENVQLSARLHGCGEGSVAAARERFDLGPFSERPVRTYSRGQRQRVALARALVHSPRLVLLDEPTTGLDAAGSARISQTVIEEAARGATVLIVTHEPAFAESVGARVIRVEHGRVVTEESAPAAR